MPDDCTTDPPLALEKLVIPAPGLETVELLEPGMTVPLPEPTAAVIVALPYGAIPEPDALAVLVALPDVKVVLMPGAGTVRLN